MATPSPWPSVSGDKLSTWPEPSSSLKMDDLQEIMDSFDGDEVEIPELHIGESNGWDLTLNLTSALLTLPTQKEAVDEKLEPVSTSTPRDAFGDEAFRGVEEVDPGYSGNNTSSSGVYPRNPRFKTEWCRNFKEKGKCLYGDYCQFAHGFEELQQCSTQNNYKTRRCNKYWMTGAGYCPYGPRCNYLHDEEADQVFVKPERFRGEPEGRRGSAGESLSSSSRGSSPTPRDAGKSKPNLPKLPPPLYLLERPQAGSGRLAAFFHNNEYVWVDTWTKTYI